MSQWVSQETIRKARAAYKAQRALSHHRTMRNNPEVKKQADLRLELAQRALVAESRGEGGSER